MEKEVSVIVPIHGVGKYLDKCLDSLLKQDFDKPYEVICVSDNCNDNSDEIIEKYVKEHPDMFKSISVCNKNPSGSRNDGLKIASGKYILFVDGDDSVLPKYISSLYNSVIKDDLDIGCSNFYNVVEGNEKKLHKEFTSHFVLRKQSSIKKARKAYAYDIRMRGFVWNKIYKKKFLDDNNIIFHKLLLPYDDVNFNFRCFAKTNKDVGFSGYRGYLYLQRKVSYTKGTKQLVLMDSTIACITYVKAYQLINHNSFPYKNFFRAKKFLLNYNFFMNKKQIENYSKIKKEYNKKFKDIVNAKSLSELNPEIVGLFDNK